MIKIGPVFKAIINILFISIIVFLLGLLLLGYSGGILLIFVGILFSLSSLFIGFAFLIIERQNNLKKSFLRLFLLGLGLILIGSVWCITMPLRVMYGKLPPMKYANTELKDILSDISKMESSVEFRIYGEELSERKISIETTQKTSVKNVINLIVNQAKCKYKPGRYCGTCGGMITPIQIYEDDYTLKNSDYQLDIYDGEFHRWKRVQRTH